MVFISILLFPPPPPSSSSSTPTPSSHNSPHPLLPFHLPPSPPSPAPERLWAGEVLGKRSSTRKGCWPWGVGSRECSRGGLPFPRRHLNGQLRCSQGHSSQGTRLQSPACCLAWAEHGMALGNTRGNLTMRDTCRCAAEVIPGLCWTGRKIQPED